MAVRRAGTPPRVPIGYDPQVAEQIDARGSREFGARGPYVVHQKTRHDRVRRQSHAPSAAEALEVRPVGHAALDDVIGVLANDP